MLKFKLLLLLSILPFNSFSQTIGLNIGTYHEKNTYKNSTGQITEYNNINPGIYIEYNDFTLGTVYNSRSDQSTYVGYKYNLYSHLDVSVGIINGYRNKTRSADDFLPFIMPSFFVPITESTNLRFTFIPQIKDTINTNSIHLSYEIKL